MDRRTALRLFAAATAASALPEELYALGRAARARFAQGLRALDPHQDATVTAIADLIIPATDTPGAAAVHVDQFIDVMLADWYDAADKDRFLAGLADVDARAKARGAPDFVSADPAAQTAILTTLDDDLARLRDSGADSDGNFWHEIKWLTLLGYYTSQVGFEQELHAQIIPGSYEPCRMIRAAAPDPGH